jgi:radical SAM protein with 4Fe4S-binding SPASM domain
MPNAHYFEDSSLWTDLILPEYAGACHIELTTYCNHFCIHCFHADVNVRNVHIDTELVLRVLDSFAKKNILQITFSGGEPFLHPDFIKIYVYAKKKGFLVGVMTNGTAYTKKIVDTFKRYPPVRISVTLFSTDAAVHDAITCVPGSLRRTMAFLEELKLRKIKSLLQINYPFMKQNSDSFRSLLKFACKNKYMLYLGIIIDSFDGSGKKIKNCFTDLIPQEVKPHNKGPTLGAYHRESAYSCRGGHSAYVIDARGYLLPCLVFRKYAWRLRKNNIDAVFQRLGTYMDTIRKKTPRPKKCFKCPAISSCEWCPARSYLETGSENKLVPRICRVAKKMQKIYNGAAPLADSLHAAFGGKRNG